MRILVTGGAGFIGSHLCARLLTEGHEIFCLDNFLTGSRSNLISGSGSSRLLIIRQDVSDPIDPALPRFDEIYNLACPASPPHYQADPVATMQACSAGARNVLDRARRDRSRLFQASTSEVYGDPQQHPQTESYTGNVHTIGPRACYDEGKRFAETLVYAYAQQYDVDAKIARIFNTYGPRMQVDDGRLISNVVVQALTGADITVHGDGLQTRSLCFVDDTVEAILRLTRSSVTAATPVNIGNPEEMTVMDVVAAVIVATGTKSRVRHLPLPTHDPLQRKPDIGRARAMLGWQPTIAFLTGLARTIDYFGSELGLATVRAAAGR
ncbi:MAG: UDP-glucuronic acid decarboxylase family protein [Sphingomonas sp.]